MEPARPLDRKLDDPSAHPSRGGQRLGWLVALATGLLVTWKYVQGETYFPDDAYIYLRYAQNLLNGDGWVFNPGETYNTATSTGIVLSMALHGLLLGQDSLRPVAEMVSLAWMMVLAAAVYGLLRARGRALALATSLSVVLVPHLYLTVGLPTAMNMALTCLAMLAYQRKRWSWLWLVLAWLPIVRLENGLLVGLFFLLAWLRDGVPLRTLVRSGIAVSLPLVLWLLFSWGYFDSVMPVSLAAKVWQTEQGYYGSSPAYLRAMATYLVFTILPWAHVADVKASLFHGNIAETLLQHPWLLVLSLGAGLLLLVGLVKGIRGGAPRGLDVLFAWAAGHTVLFGIVLNAPGFNWYFSVASLGGDLAAVRRRPRDPAPRRVRGRSHRRQLRRELFPRRAAPRRPPRGLRTARRVASRQHPGGRRAGPQRTGLPRLPQRTPHHRPLGADHPAVPAGAAPWTGGVLLGARSRRRHSAVLRGGSRQALAVAVHLARGRGHVGLRADRRIPAARLRLRPGAVSCCQPPKRPRCSSCRSNFEGPEGRTHPDSHRPGPHPDTSGGAAAGDSGGQPCASKTHPTVRSALVPGSRRRRVDARTSIPPATDVSRVRVPQRRALARRGHCVGWFRVRAPTHLRRRHHRGNSSANTGPTAPKTARSGASPIPCNRTKPCATCASSRGRPRAGSKRGRSATQCCGSRVPVRRTSHRCRTRSKRNAVPPRGTASQVKAVPRRWGQGSPKATSGAHSAERARP